MLQEDGSLDLVNNCGGHADPIHYHTDMVCHYDAENSAAHSSVVGVMNDGRGIYGRWEGGCCTAPQDASQEYTSKTAATTMI